MNTGTTTGRDTGMSTVNLIRAEVGRLAARRFVVVMLAVLLGALAITFATTVASSHTPSPAELRRAQQSVQDERERIIRTREACEAGTGRLNDRWYGADCDDYNPDNVRLESYLSGVFVFSGSITPLVMFLVVFLALFGFLVGASFVGAELASGGMTNLLLWRPQRLTVLGTKLGVLLAAVLALSIPVTLGYIGAFRLLAEVSGLPGSIGTGFWGSLFWLSLRGIVMAVGATALGFALASIGRHTAAALGVLAAYTVIWEMGARIVTQMIRTPFADLLFLSTHLAAWLDGRIMLYNAGACRGGFSRSCDASYPLHWWQGGPFLALLLAGTVLAAFALFRRRDLS